MTARKKSVSQIGVTAQSIDRVAPDCIGLADGLPPEQVLRLATDLGYAHVVQKDGLEYDKELSATEALLQEPSNFFRFPIGCMFGSTDLSPENEKSFIAADNTFHSSSEKRDLLDGFAKTMADKAFSQTLIADAILIADEMFTNAMFNAPFVHKVTQNNPGVSRSETEVNLEKHKPGRLLLAHDQSRLLVACLDQFGSLNLNGYLSKIRATYDRGAAASMNFGSGGAGLGSYIIFNTAASMFVGVESGRATLIACLLPLKMSNRMRANLPKHLHWIQLEGE